MSFRNRSASYYENKYAETEADQCSQDLMRDNAFDQNFLQTGSTVGLVAKENAYTKPDILQDCSSWCIMPKRVDLDKSLTAEPCKKFKK